MPFDLLRLGVQVLEGGQRDLQLRWLYGLKKARRHGVVDAVATHGLAGLGRQLRVDLIALVGGRVTVVQVADTHPSSAAAAQHNPLQQRASLADRAAVLAMGTVQLSARRCWLRRKCSHEM